MVRTFADAYREARETIAECYLCDSEDLLVVGGFVPEHEEQTEFSPYKPREGKRYVLFYGLCGQCFGPHAPGLVEEKARRETTATLN